MYELKLKILKEDKKGNQKEVIESYLADKVELCAEAENKALELCNGEGDVISIKVAPYKEFINSRENDEQSIYKVKLISIFINDNGEEKETSYYVGCFAEDLNKANSLVNQYVSQGMENLKINAITKTNILDII